MIVAIAGLKGGVGKTTVSLALASACVATGRRVLMIDMDPGATLTLWSNTAIAAGGAPPTTLSLAKIRPDAHQLRELANGFHVTIVDCPAQDEGLTRAALLAADVAVLPCAPTAPEIWGLARMLQLVTGIRDVRPELQTTVVLNRVDGRRNEHVTLRETLAETRTSVLAASLHGRAVHADALAAGALVHDLEPRGAAAAEAAALVAELGGRSAARTMVPAHVH